jgi:hypothetical protein
MLFSKRFTVPGKPEFNTLKDFWLPLAPTLVAIVTIFTQMTIQTQSLRFQEYQIREQLDTQRRLKEYELSFKPKQEAYTAFRSAMNDAWKTADFKEANKALERVELSYSALEPFLKGDTRLNMENQLEQLRSLSTMGDSKGDVPIILKYQKVKDAIHNLLVADLFQ